MKANQTRAADLEPDEMDEPISEAQAFAQKTFKQRAPSERLGTLPPKRRSPIAISGVPFDNVTTAEALEQIEQMVASRQPHYLVTANVDFLVQARRDVELRRILFEAHLVLCDGTPLVWASRLLGNPLPERVAGADLVPLLIQVAAKKAYRVFLLGATEQSAANAVARLKDQYPELVIAGHYSPPFNPLLEMDHAEIKRRVVDARPDLLFVSFGCPKQEKWMAMHYRSLNVPVVMGVGATIDFLAGEVRRAPRWMQRSGSEWLFRLAQEPRRLFRRYLNDLWGFNASLWPQLWQLKLRSPGPNDRSRTVCTISVQDGLRQIRMPECFDAATAQRQPLLTDETVLDGRHCLLESSQVRFIDSTGLGVLIRLQKKLHHAGRQLVLISPSSQLRRALSLMHLQDFFITAPNADAAKQWVEDLGGTQPVTQHPSATPPTLRWQGEVTAINAEEIFRLTERALETLKPEARIDLSGVSFLDSSGLGAMVRIRKLAARHGIKLTFTTPQPAVLNVIKLARLEKLLL